MTWATMITERFTNGHRANSEGYGENLFPRCCDVGWGSRVTRGCYRPTPLGVSSIESGIRRASSGATMRAGGSWRFGSAAVSGQEHRPPCDPL
jgi:hypothetical protein